jgi:hypothetical protein
MKLKKNQRIALLASLAIITCSLLYLLIDAISPGLRDEKSTLFQCENQAAIAYDVYLHPNLIFSEPILPPDKVIITEYVDYIAATCSYTYTGQDKANLTGYYEVAVLLEGYTGEGENLIPIWNKTFPIQPRMHFEQMDASHYTINKDVRLNLAQYNNYAVRISEESKVNAEVKMSLLMNIAIQAETSNGKINEHLCPSMVIPLDSSYFIVSGNPIVDKPGILEETKQIPIPVNSSKVFFLIAAISILTIMLILVLVFTKGIEPGPRMKFLKKVFKKHGDRMVALKNIAIDTFELLFEVKSIDDLVRISDEIGKPILYQYEADSNNISSLYVIDGKEMYLLTINDLPKDDDYEDIFPLRKTGEPVTEGD